jgi:hypothetical protein
MPSNDLNISYITRFYDNYIKQLVIKVYVHKFLMDQDQESCADKEILLFTRQWSRNQDLIENMRLHFPGIIELSAGNVLSVSTNTQANRLQLSSFAFLLRRFIPASISESSTQRRNDNDVYGKYKESK